MGPLQRDGALGVRLSGTRVSYVQIVSSLFLFIFISFIIIIVAFIIFIINYFEPPTGSSDPSRSKNLKRQLTSFVWTK